MSLTTRYRLGQRLGTGGMGEVYLAERTGESGFVREVAVKVIQRGGHLDERLERLFLREARTLASLHHRNIVQVFELEREGDRLYLVMERVHGIDLRKLLDTHGPLPWPMALYLAAEIARGLEAAHAVRSPEVPRGLVHGDLSLGNVMIGLDGAVKVLDFGLARPVGERSSHQGVSGKLSYFAPELLGGSPKDALTDVYALGVCLYELLTGKQPFRARTELELINLITSAPVEQVENVPPEVASLVAGALDRLREHRWQTSHAFAEEAERLARGQAGPSEVAALALRFAPPPLQHPELPEPTVEPPASETPDRDAVETRSMQVMPPTPPVPRQLNDSLRGLSQLPAGGRRGWALAALGLLGALAAGGFALSRSPAAQVVEEPTPVPAVPDAGGAVLPLPKPADIIVVEEPAQREHGAAPGRLKIRVNIRRATIVVDGKRVAENADRIDLDVTPNTPHDVSVTAGALSGRKTVTVAAGSTLPVEFVLRKRSAQVPSSPDEPDALLDPLAR